MINFNRKTRLKKAARAFENQLSRNEWILYMHFIANCNSQTLSCEISLRKLHTELKMAINTIKACRNSLKEYGLINFSRAKYATTCYEICDIVQNPISELPPKKDIQLNKSGHTPQQATYKNLNYDFVDEEIRASFILFVRHRVKMDNLSIDQDKIEKIYQDYMRIFNHGQFIEHVAYQIIMDEKDKCAAEYNLSHIDIKLKEIIKEIIWKHSRAQAPLTQREVENIYLQVFIDCEGNVERMKIMMNKLLKTI